MFLVKRQIYFFGTGEKREILLSAGPNFINRSGTGRARVAIPPRIDIEGPTPMFLNIGLTASGRAPARILRKMVLADTALAAYIW